MSSHPEDLELAARIVGGDEGAAEEFAREYTPRFRHLARRAGVPAQDCEDVAQEVFLAAFDQMQRGLYRGDSSLGVWLNSIVRGKIADYWRSRSHEVSETGLRHIDGDDREPGEGSLEGYITRVADPALVLSVREALEAMPTIYRAILLLQRSAGYTLAEIARALHLSIGQVSGRLYTSEEMFRRILRAGRSYTGSHLLQGIER